MPPSGNLVLRTGVLGGLSVAWWEETGTYSYMGQETWLTFCETLAKWSGIFGFQFSLLKCNGHTKNKNSQHFLSTYNVPGTEQRDLLLLCLYFSIALWGNLDMMPTFWWVEIWKGWITTSRPCGQWEEKTRFAAWRSDWSPGAVKNKHWWAGEGGSETINTTTTIITNVYIVL